MKPQCEAAVAKALGKDKLNQQEAARIEKRVTDAMTTLARQDRNKWLNMSKHDRLMAAGEQVAHDIRKELARKKEILAKDIIKQSQGIETLNTPGRAANQNLDRMIAHNGDMSGITSVNSEFKVIANESKRKMWNFYTKIKGGLGIWTDKNLMQDVVRERFGQDTGNKVAKQIADEIKVMYDELRVRFNAAGGDIGDLGDDFGFNTIWEGDKLKDAGLQQWLDDALKNIDRSKYVDELGNPLSNEQIKEMIAYSFDSITTNGLNKLNVGEMHQGGGKVTNRMSKSRVLHWKDADAWLDMQQKYGALPFVDLIDSHIDTMAKNIALVERFGSNPNRAFEILAQEAKRIDDANGIKTNVLTDGIRRATTMYDVFANRNMNHGSDAWNALGVAYRAWNVSTMLGSAVFAAVSDIAPMIKLARMHNLSVAKLMGNLIREMNPFNPADREVSFRMGLAVDEITSSLGRFAAEDLTSVHDRASQVARFSNTAASTIMRASLLNAWSRATKSAWSKLLMSKYAEMPKNKKWGELEAEDQAFLQSVGLDERTWEVMGLADPIKDGSGNPLMTTQSILNIPDDKLLAAMDGDVKRVVGEINSQINELNDRNAVDDQRISSRMQKVDDIKRQLSQRLLDYANRKDAQAQIEKQELQDRIDLIDAQKEAVAAQSDMNAYLRTIANQDDLKGFIDGITQGKTIDNLTDKAKKLGKTLESLDNKVATKTAKLNTKVKTFEKEIQGKFNDFNDLLNNKTKLSKEKLAEYEDKLSERLNRYATRRDVNVQREVDALNELKEIIGLKQEQLQTDFEIRKATEQTRIKGKTDQKIDSSVSRNARRNYKSGEDLGYRLGNAERRVTELRAKMRKADSGSNKAINQKFKELDKRMNALDAEFADYQAKVAERQAKREHVMKRLAGSIDGEKKALAQEIRNQAVKKYFSHVLDEQGMAIVESGLRERTKMFGKTHGGEILGFFGRGMMQFKSFPVTFLMRHGTRALRDGAFSTTPFTYMIPLAMGMGAFGALSLQLSEIANGNNPLTMWDDDDPKVALSFMTKAMMKGGGMTLLGDIVAAGADTSGRDGRDFLLGPMGGDMVKLASLTSGTANQILNGKDVTSKTNQMYMLAKSKIPGQNLWYTKTAMNRLMFDDIQNMIAPDYQQKYKRKMQKQGRSQWWETGEGLDGLNSIDFDEVVK